VADTVRDEFGRLVSFTSVPQRVVSLSPTTTEIIFTIGANARLIGRSHWDHWPAAAMAVPDMGDAIRPNVEQLVAAHPDLVILYASEANESAAARLQRAGIRTLSLRISTVEEFYRDTRLLGRLLGDSAAGDQVADSVFRSLARVRAATARLPRPSVVWPVAARPPMVVGGGSFMNDLIEAAGARNVYAALPGPSRPVSIEDIVAHDPDFIIRGGSLDVSPSLDGAWLAIDAVRDGRIIHVPTTLVARPSVQMGMAAAALARALHRGIQLP
jgi:ABC-type Fe3+-hydroxamate transport system substrate-binding protein